MTKRIQNHLELVTMVISLMIPRPVVAGEYCLRHQQLVKEQDFIFSCVVSVCLQLLVVVEQLIMLSSHV